MAEHIVSTKKNLVVYFALLVLLGLTFVLSYVDLGHFSGAVALLIATIKALLVAMFFMHLRYSKGLIRMAAVVGVFWLLILMSLSLSDYVSRNWLSAPGHWPQERRAKP